MAARRPRQAQQKAARLVSVEGERAVSGGTSGEDKGMSTFSTMNGVVQRWMRRRYQPNSAAARSLIRSLGRLRRWLLLEAIEGVVGRYRAAF